jgi:hypothetical protein
MFLSPGVFVSLVAVLIFKMLLGPASPNVVGLAFQAMTSLHPPVGMFTVQHAGIQQ